MQAGEIQNSNLPINKGDASVYEGIANALFFLFEVVLFAYTSLLPALKPVVAAVGIACFAYVLVFSDRQKQIVCITAILYACAVTSAVYTGNYRFEEFVMPLMYLGPGLLLCFYTINMRAAHAFFMFTVVFYLAALSGIGGQNAFSNYSENYISVNVFNSCTIYYIAGWKNRETYRLYPTLLAAVLCLLSEGRAAILTGAALLVLSIFYYLWRRRRLENRRNVLAVFGILFAVLFVYFYLFDMYILPYLVKFSSSFDPGLTSTGRTMLMTEYWTQIKSTAWNLAFGVPCRENYVFRLFGANWHCSYLRLHCFFGLAGCACVAGGSALALRVMWRKNRMLFILLAVILVRISTDSAAFNGSFDPLLYFFFMTAFIPETELPGDYLTEEAAP